MMRPHRIRSDLRVRFRRLRPWCAAFVVFAGCGPGYDLPELVPASGSVKVDGRPSAGVTVTFLAEGGTAGSGGTATTGDDGSFTILHRTGAPGLAAGAYKVVFSRFALPNGAPMPRDSGASAATLGALETLPREYTDPTRTRRVVTIPSPAPLAFEIVTRSAARRRG